MRIFLSGYYGFKNLGDELLLYKIVKDISQVCPAEFFVWTGDPAFTEKFLKDFSIIPVYRFSPSDTVQAVKNSEVVVLGGGGIIQEYYGIKVEQMFTSFGYNIPAYGIPPLLGKIFDKKVFYWGLGHGVTVTDEAEAFSRWFYSLADIITVRDRFSYKYIKEKLGKSNVFLDTDPLMSLNFEKKADKNILGVSIRKWFNEEDIVEKLSKALNKVLEEEDIEVLLIPCDLDLDKELTFRLYEKISSGRVSIASVETPFEVVDSITRCRWFLGMRLHSIIVAYRTEIPVLSLSYDVKTEEVADELGISSLKVTELSQEELYKGIKNLLKQKPNKPLNFDYKTPAIFKDFLQNKELTTQHRQDNYELERKESLYIKDFVKTLFLQREGFYQQISRLEHELKSLREENETQRQQIESLTSQLNHALADRDMYLQRLNEIYTSNFWKVASFYYKIRSKPPFKQIYSSIKVIKNEGFLSFFNRVSRKTFHKEEKKIEPKFNPYRALQPLNPDCEVIVLEKDYSDLFAKSFSGEFSIIIPVKNEANTIERVVETLASSSILPYEVIFIENNSTDETPEILKRLKTAYRDRFRIKIIHSDKTLSEDRNLGIKSAEKEWIVFLDAGQELEKGTLKNLLSPLKEFPDADLLAGIYLPVERDNYWSQKFVWNWNSIDFSSFIPSCRCVAVKKSLAEKTKFDEFLPYTGEDTLFMLKYRKFSKKWVINKACKVYWKAPAEKEEAIKKAYLYGKGDGHIGYGEFQFYKELIAYLKTGNIHSSGEVETSYLKGFIEGRTERVRLLKDKGVCRGVFLILSGVPFTDSGGGQRGTQIALELMKQGYRVVFLNIYPSFEKEVKVFLDVEYPMLELYHFEDFSPDDFIERHRVFEKVYLLLEFPHPEFIPLTEKLKSLKKETKVIYDCIDNWDSSLGWVWYSREKEEEIIKNSDYIVASAKTLQLRMERMLEKLGIQKNVFFLPNSVNLRLFNPDFSFSPPDDLPVDRPIIGYVGALWGEWFDWALIQKLVELYSDYNFVFIGNIPEGKEEIKNLQKNYSNVYFLGLKPQFLLPKYLKFFKIGLIPFRYDEITKYTNPLKLYEYLAMGIPVVSSDMDELRGAPYVFLSRNHEEFIESVKKALITTTEYQKIYDFVKVYSWEHNLRNFLHFLEENE